MYSSIRLLLLLDSIIFQSYNLHLFKARVCSCTFDTDPVFEYFLLTLFLIQKIFLRFDIIRPEVLNQCSTYLLQAFCKILKAVY